MNLRQLNVKRKSLYKLRKARIINKSQYFVKLRDLVRCESKDCNFKAVCTIMEFEDEDSKKPIREHRACQFCMSRAMSNYKESCTGHIQVCYEATGDGVDG